MKNTNIANKQNSLDAIRMLLVQRILYRNAKRLKVFEFVIVVIIPILAYLLNYYNIGAKGLVALFSILSMMLNLTFFQIVIYKFTNKAVNIQEQLDCFLFDLKWSNLKFKNYENYRAALKISDEQTQLLAKKEKLYDWYSLPTKNKDIEKTIIFCQKQNITFSQSLQIENEWFFWISIILLLVFETFTSYYLKLQLSELIDVLYLPIMPLLSWLINNYLQVRRYLTNLNNSYDYIKKIENTKISYYDLRLIQDKIVELRKMAPAILDWYYFMRRTKIQNTIKS
jgi:hypothetical protein